MLTKRLNFFILCIVFSCSCIQNKKIKSRTTGMLILNNSFSKKYSQFVPESMVFIEGGTFVMGISPGGINQDWGNMQHRVTVSSFFMDETEVSNIIYRNYINWLKIVYAERPERIEEAMPNQLVWREKMAYNDPYVRNYFLHPAYSNYPVVGVSWKQATEYCKWRTDRINEKLLIKAGILNNVSEQKDISNFKTETYLNNIYLGNRRNKEVDKTHSISKAVIEDGILSTNFRLPTEAEWEYAALGLIGNIDNQGFLSNQKIFPWNGSSLRNDLSNKKGDFRANFVRGSGDLMGVAGNLNDNADISAPVYSYEPNDYGLYCMSGNVNEWTLDVYRDVSPANYTEFRSFRGNVHISYLKDSIRYLVNRFGELILDSTNCADYRDYLDGDSISLVEYELFNEVNMNHDELRVYKGGSWMDRSYWLHPGTRRFLNEESSLSDLGFRCIVDKLGSPNLDPK